MNIKQEGWKHELQSIIEQNVSIKANGKKARNKTKSDRATFLFALFNFLREKGYAVSPHNLKPKHIQAACDHYIHVKNVAPATIQTYLMHMRAFARWIGKDGMVKSAKEYIADKTKYERTYQAVCDKGFEGNGIDIRALIEKIKNEYPYVYHQLLAQTAFGLRCKESLFLRPYIHIVEGTVQAIDGTKGNKHRILPIENDNQIEVVKILKQFVGKTAYSLMDPKLTLPQNYSKYYRVCAKFGITKRKLGRTMHSSRADYAMNFMIGEGLIPLVKGGEIGQLPKDEEMEIRLKTSQRLGHNRVSITTAYSGPMTKAGKKRIEKAKETKVAIKIKDDNSSEQ